VDEGPRDENGDGSGDDMEAKGGGFKAFDIAQDEGDGKKADGSGADDEDEEEGGAGILQAGVAAGLVGVLGGDDDPGHDESGDGKGFPGEDGEEREWHVAVEGEADEDGDDATAGDAVMGVEGISARTFGLGVLAHDVAKVAQSGGGVAEKLPGVFRFGLLRGD
jgi:hypothetical protein